MTYLNPAKNYEATRKRVTYVPYHLAKPADYERIGFKSGLEVHQQLLTRQKLFCRCPAGHYQEPDDFDAEIIRHMRPTLSELGEYDGTALMEFKTKKNITYRVKTENMCTYEIDDTPPFQLDREALSIALEIALLLKLNIVGELHIIRKQYLDGSIPTGFQRTGILGIEGVIPLREKTVRIMQLSIEEDSCREVSDIGHERIFRTDRLGMPLIEVVTYPDMKTPLEVAEACQYIRFLNRSTGKVRTGMGAARQDVNVSCEGGTRVEIKGVAKIKWIPKLTHNESFRQYALLEIKKEIEARGLTTENWHISHQDLEFHLFNLDYPTFKEAKKKKLRLTAVNLPRFEGLLSFFTQPGHCFASEIETRLKVIACLEKPNMTHSEELVAKLSGAEWEFIRSELQAQNGDAQILIWGPRADVDTALETIEERCRMAFRGVPNETRKSLPDGTTIFERVLPGAERMYPDTDSVPIAITEELIENLRRELPIDVIENIRQLDEWRIPRDTYFYLMKRNLVPIMKKIVNTFRVEPRFVSTLFGHTLKRIECKLKSSGDFNYHKIFDIFSFVKDKELTWEIIPEMLPEIYLHPNMEFDSVLNTLGFLHVSEEDIVSTIPILKEKYREIHTSPDPQAESRWIMGQLRSMAVGNMPLTKLAKMVNFKD